MARGITSPLLVAGWSSTARIHHILFIPSPLGGRGSFPVFSCYDNAAVDVHVRVVVWMSVFSSLGYVTGSGIAGSYGNAIFVFWGTAKLLCKSSCTISHSRGASWVGFWKTPPGGPAAPTLPSWKVTCFWPERQKRVWGAPLQGLWLTSVGPAQCSSLFLLRGKSGRALIGCDHVRVGALGFHSGLLPLTFCVTWDESGDLAEPPFDRPVAGRAVRGHVHLSLAVCQPVGAAPMLGAAAL